MAFVLDGSGSVGRPDFSLMLQFVAEVAAALPVGVDGARVAQVVYGSSAAVTFHFKDHMNHGDLRQAILASRFREYLSHTLLFFFYSLFVL